jgi:hypothetical protein
MTEPLWRDVFAVCTQLKTRQKIKATSTRNFSTRGNISRYFFAVFLTDLHGKRLCRVLISNTRQRMNSGCRNFFARGNISRYFFAVFLTD